MFETVFPGLASALNVHPLLVHFPIALWPVALLLWALALVRGGEGLWQAGRWLLYLGTLGALAAAGTGLWAADQLGHDTPGHDLVHVHRNWMLTTTALSMASAAVAFAWSKRATPISRWLPFCALVLTVAVSVLGADRGALLVYRYGIGTSIGADLVVPQDPVGPQEEEEHHSHGDHAH